MGRVKICSNNHVNEEGAQKCSQCGELLVAVPPTWLDESGVTGRDISQRDADESVEGGEPEPIHEPPQSRAGEVRRTQGVAQDLLVLQFVRGNRVFNVRNGQILGSDDDSGGENRVNIPRDAGVDVSYVSRWHCRFDRVDERWYVTPLNPRHYGSDLEHPNPTFLGSQLLPVDEQREVANGDRLTLADVELRIVIPGAAS